MKFSEAKLEKAFTELLGNEGFPHHLGIPIKRLPDEVFFAPFDFTIKPRTRYIEI